MDAMTASVDFPVPRMPMRTMEASGSNTRRISWGEEVGTGVCRGVERALEVIDVTTFWSARTTYSSPMLLTRLFYARLGALSGIEASV